MGGVAGHMSHIYENPGLTFTKIKDIFTAASAGELEGTEKTDGQNLFISYSVKDGEARAARNKGNIKTGGLSPAGLAQKFAGRGALEKTFNESFQAFEKAVRSLPQEAQVEIFGPDANIYYNAEIQDPRTANVINYDTKTLNIHDVGHAEFDRETGTIKDVDISKNAATLDAALEKMQQSIEDDEYNIQKNAIRNLEGLGDDTELTKTISRIEQATQAAGISDNHTIADYLVARIVPFIEANVDLPEDNKKLLLQRMLGVKGVTFNHVVKGLDKEKKEIVRAIVKSSKKLLKDAIAPIEDIVHDFSVEMLKGLQSAFILDNPKEVSRIRQEVSKAIDAIEASGSEEAIAILNQQMRKLKGVENISTAAEGFVFDYDGQTYKFTGNFAPINQILGLFRYGRGSVPPLSLAEQEEGGTLERCERLVAIVPGAFKPPHRGHYDMVKHYSSIVGSDGKVIVMISPIKASERKSFNPETQSDVDNEQSLALWNLYTAGLPNVEVQLSPMRSPVRASLDFVGEQAEPGDCVILGTSTKGGDQSRFANNMQKYAGEGVRVPNPLQYAFDPTENLSATDIRVAAKEGDIEKVLSFVPDDAMGKKEEILKVLGLSGALPENKKKSKRDELLSYIRGLVEEVLDERDYQKDSERIKSYMKDWHKMLGSGPQKPGSPYTKKRPSKRAKSGPVGFSALEEDGLEETSSMGGGMGAGYAGTKKKNNFNGLIREDELVEKILDYLLKKMGAK